MKDNTAKKLEYDDIFDQAVDDFQNQTVVNPEDELEIPPLKVDVKIDFEKIESIDDKTDFISDMQYLRTKLLTGIGQADQILQSLLKRINIDDSLNGDTQPKGFYRYYEVSSQILKQICDASKELVNLHASNTKIKKDMGWDKVKTDEEVNIGDRKVNMTLKDIISEVKKENHDE